MSYKAAPWVYRTRTKDLISSHIYEKDGEILVESSWQKDARVRWRHILKNPYLWVGPSDLFQYDTRDLWVVFTIALNDGVPKLVKPFLGDAELRDRIVEQDIKNLAKTGIKITREGYRKYLNSFKGLILQYGDPEMGGGYLDIWYEPAQRFIPYYRP